MAWHFLAAETRHARRSHKEVGQFVCEREHLCRLEVGRVNENQGRMAVYQSEPLELAPVQFAARIVADDSVEDGKDSHFIRAVPKVAKCGGPVGLRRGPTYG